jgi:hypothetical protein
MRASGIFFNELGPKGSLQDGEERLIVDCFHDQGDAGLIAIWEGEVVDAHTPLRLYCSRELAVSLRMEVVRSLVRMSAWSDLGGHCFGGL